MSSTKTPPFVLIARNVAAVLAGVSLIAMAAALAIGRMDAATIGAGLISALALGATFAPRRDAAERIIIAVFACLVSFIAAARMALHMAPVFLDAWGG